MSAALYICYFGVNEPLVQTQVIPYLRELVKGGHELTLLTFEPGDVDESAVRERLRSDGIEWHWLRYHKRPSVPATLFDIANAVRFVRKLMKTRRFDILHARSHVPMIMAALARKACKHKPKILFDIRGFLPEEYVDAGVWDEEGAIYRNFKRIENWLMKQADGFVVLTEAARNLLFPGTELDQKDTLGRPIAVIPCCVDLRQRFSSQRETLRGKFRSKLGVEGRFVVLHLGALGGLYLVKEIADLIAVGKERDPSVFALILTQSDPQLIEPLLLNHGFNSDDFYIARVPPAEVEGWLYASDLGLSIVKSTYATASRSPTKIAEYLAAGIPIITNAGVGDVDTLISRNEIGAILSDFSRESYLSAFKLIDELGDIRDHCRATAFREFEIGAIGGPRYQKVYREILQSNL
jgi:glycosyltransferase involved in cell wall biosynthesis